jgi:hypothetical protein
VYILETGPENKDKLFKYISSKYVYGYYSQQASCRGTLTLLYIRTMFDKSEFRGKPFGREHLSQAIEKKFGIKTRESFQFVNDQERLGNYCRVDAELCDALLKVDLANKSQGLCGDAILECRDADTPNRLTELLAACRRLPAAVFACLEYAPNGRERIACKDQVLAKLCPHVEATP